MEALEAERLAAAAQAVARVDEAVAAAVAEAIELSRTTISIDSVVGEVKILAFTALAALPGGTATVSLGRLVADVDVPLPK